jgi:DNA-binding NtrC family response regulator
VVFADDGPAARVVPLVARRIELGREERGDGACKLDDGRISRHHARVELDGLRWLVTDLGSHNGTFADGRRIPPQKPTPFERVLRIGDTLLVPCAEVDPLETAGVRDVHGFVRGPAMQAILAAAERAGRAGTRLHVHGETGTGKEAVVQTFHRASPRASRTLVSVNCAMIPDNLAERLLFGAKRGAFSGADADAIGYVQEADGSTLFLDEIADLDVHVQAKLLRLLESNELLPVGASRPRKVDFTLCSATNKDLRALVAAGSLREDLYFRIATPAVTLLPLRDRPEEIPALIARELSRLSPAPQAHVTLVEQCLLRPWPGNVRELLAEVRTAAQAAAAAGQRVMADHLAPTAGSVFGGDLGRRPVPAVAAGSPSAGSRRARISRRDEAWRQRIADALCTAGGNISAAARTLGVYRNELRRLMLHHGLTAERASTPGE